MAAESETTPHDWEMREVSTEALIWANRFINLGAGVSPKLCNDVQARCMQAAIDEAYQKGMRDGKAA